LPIIVVSARTQDADKQMANQVGANGYLTKPYRRAELLALIRPGFPSKSSGHHPATERGIFCARFDDERSIRPSFSRQRLRVFDPHQRAQCQHRVASSLLTARSSTIVTRSLEEPLQFPAQLAFDLEPILRQSASKV